MNYRRLGKSGLRVSELSYGSWVTFSFQLDKRKAKKAMKAMDAGSTLEVISTDPGSVRDFEAFSSATGNELLESVEESGVFRFVIQKS